jgi:hypothetical protein
MAARDAHVTIGSPFETVFSLSLKWNQFLDVSNSIQEKL